MTFDPPPLEAGAEVVQPIVSYPDTHAESGEHLWVHGWYSEIPLALG